jgi:2-hydroxychromene-2-carboxylate isomerase
MIEVFFDCSSPWTYLAFHNLQLMSADLKAPIQWRPMLVGGVFNTVNPSVYESRQHPIPAKAAYMLKDLADWAREAGLTIRMPPSVFPVNSVKAMRACILLAPEGKLVAFARAAFEAYWSRDEDISRNDVLEGVCRAAGVDPADVLAGIADQAIKAALKANTDEVMARGGFGSPTIFVGGTDMYFGNDRLPLVRAAVLRARGGAS